MALTMMFLIQTFGVDIFPNLIFINILSIGILFVGYPTAQGTDKTIHFAEKINMLLSINLSVTIFNMYVLMVN